MGNKYTVVKGEGLKVDYVLMNIINPCTLTCGNHDPLQVTVPLVLCTIHSTIPHVHAHSLEGAICPFAESAYILITIWCTYL